MLGDIIRDAREARSWTQAHLAEAAAISLRTVQRLECEHVCAPETLLAVASALEVDVRMLAAQRAVRDNGPYLQPRRAALSAALLMAPCMAFVAVNLLKSGVGLGAPYDALAGLGGALRLEPLFELLSPPLFIGGPVLAMAVVIAAQARIRRSNGGGPLVLTGVSLYPSVANLLVGTLALASLATLLLYAIGEALGHAGFR